MKNSHWNICVNYSFEAIVVIVLKLQA